MKPAKNKLAIPKRGEEEFDDATSDNAQYGRVQFWDLRYASEHEPFEWYYGYDYFQATIREKVPLDENVMIAGCGSSNMLGDMADDGYEQLTGLDISRVCIAQLRYRYKDYPQITLRNGNVTDTDLPEGSFGAIIDKALFDSLLCTQTSHITIAQYLYEVERLLHDEGVFIVISHGSPEQRLPLLEQYDIDEPQFTPWVIEVQGLSKYLRPALARFYSLAYLYPQPNVLGLVQPSPESTPRRYSTPTTPPPCISSTSARRPRSWC